MNAKLKSIKNKLLFDWMVHNRSKGGIINCLWFLLEKNTNKNRLQTTHGPCYSTTTGRIYAILTSGSIESQWHGLSHNMYMVIGVGKFTEMINRLRSVLTWLLLHLFRIVLIPSIRNFWNSQFI